jgi:virulence factor Mce-like protein
MQKQAPTLGKLAVIIGFALSCFAILIYLWVTFGGPIPLKPRGYEVKVPFQEATQLAEQSDVRITGVSVGKVSTIQPSEDGEAAEATLEIDAAYAPLPSNTRAILRSKTLLGEAYVELTSGDPSKGMLEEGETLPDAQVAPTVQLDEILRTFDQPTRAGFQTWMQDAAIATAGRGDDLSNAIAQLAPTFDQLDQFFVNLDRESQAVRQLFANGSVTFDALSRRRGELRGLIASAERMFAATGRRNRDISATFRAFPTFIDESIVTLDRLKRFARETDPLMRQLTPVATQLSPDLVQIERMAPHLRGLFTGLRPVVNAAPRGFPSLQKLFRDDFPPVLQELPPFLRQLNPIIDEAGQYRREITSLFANVTAATNVRRTGEPRILRGLVTLRPETVATFPGRLKVNRTNSYTKPYLYRRLIPPLLNFETRQCTSGITALLDPTSPTDPAFNARTGGDLAQAQNFFNRIQSFLFSGKTDSDDVPATSCAKQSAFDPVGAPGPATDYPHVLAQP